MEKQPNLSQLIEQARRVHMTAEQLESQKRDFAYGNTKFENDAITREMIDEAADARLRD